MKNIFFTAAFLFAIGANAATNMFSGLYLVEVKQNKEYRKVDATSVPAAILKDVSTKYSGYVIKEAYASDDNEYKLELNKDKKAVTVYYSSTGEFVKEHA
ncbi:hypothetical protein FMM05_08775 [Flavobacterium zepuense]|uniref:Beta-lactamase-inhibitor-like PepSY-like domain-containing protein n=1 Tax=Flavobacterium zepuense TaxID=2593302 RepID=A0A552V4H1_9FLAO|nr:hypothetical protein [Flavobacterium zepuense]TRW25386.1 hypothetical protein FMM05_08775 [Flavobacterium zepuense]